MKCARCPESRIIAKIGSQPELLVVAVAYRSGAMGEETRQKPRIRKVIENCMV